jgi:hypothetical protein
MHLFGDLRGIDSETVVPLACWLRVPTGEFCGGGCPVPVPGEPVPGPPQRVTWRIVRSGITPGYPAVCRM